MLRKTALVVVSIGAISLAAWMLLGSQRAASDETLASKVEKVMAEESAKPRFSGQLGDFEVFSGGELPEKARLFACADGAAMAQLNRNETALRSSELWSATFDVEEGAGWSCPGTGVMLVNNQGLEGETSDGEGVSKIRGYFTSLPVPVLRDAPKDRLELVQVDGHPGLLENPIDGYPYGWANLVVIERYPDGQKPGIVLFVERASSAKRATEIAKEIMQ